MTDTLVSRPAPPPAAAEASGPVSTQPETISNQMLPSGETPGSQPQGTAAGATPAQATSTLATGTSAQGVASGLAQRVALAISLGLAQSPQNAAGWAKLVDYYSTTAGQNAITTAEQTQGPTATTSAAPAQQTGGSALGTNAFLAAIRQHESGGNYQAYNSGGGASGAYQFIQSTWTSQANAAGFSKYANEPAGNAPPEVQDAVAAHMANSYFAQYGSWQDAAEAWYEPADVGKNVVPAPGAGNTETVTQYGAQIVAAMGQQPQQDTGSAGAGSSDAITKIASSQIGVPYVWGGEEAIGPGQKGAFDCSGLVQWVFQQAGEHLPRVAQAQYDATPKVAKGQALQPGDLLFFGSGPGSIEHVGIYIGNNQMIDAPHTGANVRIDANPTQWGNYVGATRPGDPGGSSTVASGTPAGQALAQSQQNYGQILQGVTQQLAQLSQQYPGIFQSTQAVNP